MQTFFEKTQALFDKMKNDPENKLLYRNEIVEVNMKLVTHVLKKYKPYNDDQYQAGCMGLILAVDTFKEDRGVPFHNYACFCIERELHKLHRYQNSLIESIISDKMIYLDDTLSLDEGSCTVADTIKDVLAEEDFDLMIEENDLQRLFDKVVIPSIELIAQANKGQSIKINIKDWKELELRYLLEMSQGSQKMRFNLSQMAKHLQMSVQNVRTRHLRVVDVIKKTCKEEGYR